MRRGVVVMLLGLAACSSSGPRAAPGRSTSSVPATRATTSTSTTTTRPPRASTSTSTSRPVGGSGLWTDRHLTITTQTLGAVRVGMSVAAAQAAAGAVFDGMGDGVAYPTTLPAGYAHLVVDGDPVFC